MGKGDRWGVFLILEPFMTYFKGEILYVIQEDNLPIYIQIWYKTIYSRELRAFFWASLTGQLGVFQLSLMNQNYIKA